MNEIFALFRKSQPGVCRIYSAKYGVDNALYAMRCDLEEGRTGFWLAQAEKDPKLFDDPDDLETVVLERTNGDLQEKLARWRSSRDVVVARIKDSQAAPPSEPPLSDKIERWVELTQELFGVGALTFTIPTTDVPRAIIIKARDQNLLDDVGEQMGFETSPQPQPVIRDEVDIPY